MSGIADTITENSRLRNENADLLEENEHLLTLLSLIVHVLPSRRDWLDPNLEKAAKNAIAHAKAKGQGGE